ncbi:MAG TPA: DUF4136 domain-containing protein [Methylibium sp.]|uniref:DUF4136 domain-containing protein n=1 Tax=Methylibium sp. TaxID=2067992 RepID=UPI002DBB4AE9|nr:DUF4136 domain-containing protein [Methylibium sp.]HEU4460892.1 DUF4136 domain-containing protein [Methylibium sp.]
MGRIDRRHLLLSVVCAGALSACGGLSSVSIDVSSQGDWPNGAKPGTYAIERLPSQQANAVEQARIEAAALPALAAAGFTQAPADTADVLIQVGARAFDVVRRDPFASPFYWRSNWWYGGYHRPFFYGPGLYGPGFYRPGWGYDGYDVDVQREVAVLIRDRRSQRIVYETRASYLNRWGGDALLPAMFEAAMKDFPNTAISPRTVVVNLPRG